MKSKKCIKFESILTENKRRQDILPKKKLEKGNKKLKKQLVSEEYLQPISFIEYFEMFFCFVLLIKLVGGAKISKNLFIRNKISFRD